MSDKYKIGTIINKKQHPDVIKAKLEVSQAKTMLQVAKTKLKTVKLEVQMRAKLAFVEESLVNIKQTKN